MSSIDHDVRMAFVGIKFCDGPGLASNDGIATPSPSSADRRLPANSKTSAGRNADRITRFLADRRPAPFCDDCIADKRGLSNRREANRITCIGKIIEGDGIFLRDKHSSHKLNAHGYVHFA